MNEVSKLMVYAAKIKTWRKTMRREGSRLRMVTSRKKRHVASINRDALANKKLEVPRKYDRRKRKCGNMNRTVKGSKKVGKTKAEKLRKPRGRTS